MPSHRTNELRIRLLVILGISCVATFLPTSVGFAHSILSAPAPKGYWNIDEVEGAVLLDQLGLSNASFTGTRVPGVRGGGMGPLSQGTIPVCPVNLNASSWTTMAWFKLSAGQTGGYIMGNQVGPNDPGPSGFITVWAGPEIVFISTNNGLVTCTPALSVNVWHHLAVTFDMTAAMLSIFLDGQIVGAVATPGGFGFGGNGAFTLGALFSGTLPAHLFVGDTDEYAIFDKALTAAELLSIAAKVLTPAPKGYWNIDEIDGAVLLDQLGQSNASFTGTRVTGVRGGGMGPLSQGTMPVCPVNFNTGSWTTMAWFKMSPGQAGGYIMGNQVGANDPGPAGYINVAVGPENIYLYTFNGSVTSPPVVSADGAWHHLAVTFDMTATMLSIFLDGQIVGAVASSGGFGFGGTGAFTLGALFSGTLPGHLFVGDTDEYAIFDQALTGAQLLAYEGDFSPPPTNQPPISNAGPDRTVNIGEAITFDGSGSFDPDGTIASFGWSFGDTTTANGMAPVKAYSSPGVYSVVLTATDNQGAVSIDTATVTVRTSQQQIQLIAIDVLSLVTDGALNQGQGDSLSTKLQKAIAQMDPGGSAATAKNLLNAFINQVQALLASGRITNEEAQSLIDAARAVIAQLGS
jgi:hypothetical protein